MWFPICLFELHLLPLAEFTFRVASGSRFLCFCRKPDAVSYLFARTPLPPLAEFTFRVASGSQFLCFLRKPVAVSYL